MAKIVFLLVLLCISASFAKKKKDEEKPDWAKKDIRDFSDADMERYVNNTTMFDFLFLDPVILT